MSASSSVVISNLAYLVGAVVLAFLGGLLVWLRHRRPRSVDANVESFHRGLRALAPDGTMARAATRSAPRPAGPAPRSLPAGVRIQPPTLTPPDGHAPADSLVSLPARPDEGEGEEAYADEEGAVDDEAGDEGQGHAGDVGVDDQPEELEEPELAEADGSDDIARREVEGAHAASGDKDDQTGAAEDAGNRAEAEAG